MIRTVISIDPDDKAWLDREAKRRGVSMTRVVQHAISDMRKRAEIHPAGFDRLLRETAGITRLGDGLTYQRKMRAEWDKQK
ncbi:MAG TPA: hypothetical protein VHP37_18010 [Burkholderiales bacterium]|nr:hypothetical protein [Burkholderiales bacterium]